MLSPVLAALLEAPSGLVRLMDALTVLTLFLSPLVLGMLGLCSPNKQSHIYLHPQGLSQRLLYLTAVPRPALGYPLCSVGTLGVRAEIGDLVTDRWLGVTAVQRKVTL